MKIRIKLRTYIYFFILFTISANSFSIIDKATDFLQKYSQKQPNFFQTNLVKTDMQISKLGINKTILKENLKGNILIVDNFVLIPQNNDEFPQLIRLNLETAQTETFKYPKILRWSNYTSTFISDWKNGELGYSVCSSLLVLDKKTLAFKKMVNSSEKFYSLMNSHVYVDQITKQRRTMVQVGSGSAVQLFELKQDKAGEYLLQFRSYLLGEPYSALDFQMTGTNTGVIVRWTNITYLQNFNTIIDFSYDKKYLLKSRQHIAVSYDETMFVARNDNSYYEFYLLDEKYDIKIKQSILISYNQHRRAEFTTDDKFLIVSMTNPRKIHNIAKVTIQENEFVFITDSDGVSDNHIDFNLFAIETDRMIVLALKGVTYVIQLRTISSLAVLHEMPLKFNFTSINCKLVGSVQWGLSFALAARFTSDYKEEQNAYLYKFIVSGDKISQSAVSGKFNFDNLRACSKYFISYKATYQGVKVYHYSDFSFAKNISQWSSFDLIFEKNMILAGSQEMQLYDFSKSLDYQGVVFTQKQPLIQRFQFLFAKRGVYIQLSTTEYYAGRVMRIVYNISIPSAKKVVMMDQDWSWVHSEQYFQESQKSSCNKVYYIWRKYFGYDIYNLSIAQYDECSQIQTKYPYSILAGGKLNLILSNDRKYFISLLQIQRQSSAHSGFWVDIREQKNLTNVVFLKQYQLGDLRDNYSIYDLTADIINGSTVIIKFSNFIKLQSINSANAKSEKEQIH